MFARIARSVKHTHQIPTRSFAKAKKVVVPKQLFGVHGTYATALFQSAGSAGNLDKVEADLKNFVGHIDSNDAFRAFLTNPTIPRVSKKAEKDKKKGQ